MSRIPYSFFLKNMINVLKSVYFCPRAIHNTWVDVLNFADRMPWRLSYPNRTPLVRLFQKCRVCIDTSCDSCMMFQVIHLRAVGSCVLRAFLRGIRWLSRVPLSTSSPITYDYAWKRAHDSRKVLRFTVFNAVSATILPRGKVDAKCKPSSVAKRSYLAFRYDSIGSNVAGQPPQNWTEYRLLSCATEPIVSFQHVSIWVNNYIKVHLSYISLGAEFQVLFNAKKVIMDGIMDDLTYYSTTIASSDSESDVNDLEIGSTHSAILYFEKMLKEQVCRKSQSWGYLSVCMTTLTPVLPMMKYFQSPRQPFS